MKSLLLLLSLSFSSCLVAMTYEKLKDDLKESLYKKQIGLMEQDAYYKFIDPYISRAEQELKIFECKNQTDLESYQDYFDSLYNYNVQVFIHYVYPGSPMDRIKSATTRLKNSILSIKEELQLQDLDTEAEFLRTQKLFEEANQAYYYKLGYAFRFKTYSASKIMGAVKYFYSKR